MTNVLPKPRSGRFTTKNDELIDQLLADPNYRVYQDGTIETLITKTGKKSVSNTWRIAGYTRKVSKSLNYRSIKYCGSNLLVHRIIYRAFIGELSTDLVINHKDGLGTNNQASNLELVSMSENNTHRYRVLNNPGVKGRAKINQEIAESIRKDHSSGISYRQLCIKYGLAKSTISYIVTNKTWTPEKTLPLKIAS